MCKCDDNNANMKCNHLASWVMEKRSTRPASLDWGRWVSFWRVDQGNWTFSLASICRVGCGLVGHKGGQTRGA